VIIARDIKIRGMERFKGKKIIEIGVAEAIRKADSIIAKAEKEVSGD
jgi:fructose-specific PTS system IIB-like component